MRRAWVLIPVALLLGCDAEPIVLGEQDPGAATTGEDADTDAPDAPDTNDTGPPTDDLSSGAPCSVAADCVGLVALQPCRLPVCSGGQCEVGPGADDAPCDDGDPCFVGRTCLAGECQGGQALPCDDGNSCTADGCEPAEGCVHVPFSGGCDDGNPCTLADHCIDETCKAGNSVCQCTVDADCAPWQDSDPCNGTLKCLASACQVDPATLPTCPGGVAGPCLVFACDPATGSCGPVPVADETACTDGDVCTVGDTCQAGQCTGGAFGCPCSDDVGCLAYDDGDLCNGVLRCEIGQCVADASSVISCTTGNPCEAGACDPATGACSADPVEGAACDDGDACTSADACAGGECVGQPVTCDDSNPCTDDACDAVGDCTFTPNEGGCDDGDECTKVDLCQAGVCVGMDDQCSCVTTADCAAFQSADLCVGTLVCVGGKCTAQPGTEVVCDQIAGTDCMVDQCVPALGECQPVPVADGTECFDGDPCTEGETCQGGVCGADLVGCGCAPGNTLKCNTSTFWSNDAFGFTDVIDAWPCKVGDFSGPEYAWPFTVTSPTKVAVHLQNEEASTALFIVEDAGSGCSPSGCMDYAPGKTDFVALPGTTYYVVADGKAGAAGKFTLAVSCTSAIEIDCDDGKDDDDDDLVDCFDPDCENDIACVPSENCGNGVDDDANGLVDCADPDCVGQPLCDTVCYASATIYCGFSQFWQTTGEGVGNDVAKYGCSFGDWSGPDFTYAFNANKSELVTVQLISAFPGHQIFVMQDQGGGCNGEYCIQGSPNQVTFFATQGVKYYVNIDGANGVAGSYQLQVGCE